MADMNSTSKPANHTTNYHNRKTSKSSFKNAPSGEKIKQSAIIVTRRPTKSATSPAIIARKKVRELNLSTIDPA